MKYHELTSQLLNECAKKEIPYSGIVFDEIVCSYLTEKAKLFQDNKFWSVTKAEEILGLTETVEEVWCEHWVASTTGWYYKGSFHYQGYTLRPPLFCGDCGTPRPSKYVKEEAKPKGEVKEVCQKCFSYCCLCGKNVRTSSGFYGKFLQETEHNYCPDCYSKATDIYLADLRLKNMPRPESEPKEENIDISREGQAHCSLHGFQDVVLNKYKEFQCIKCANKPSEPKSEVPLPEKIDDGIIMLNAAQRSLHLDEKTALKVNEIIDWLRSSK